MRWKPWPFLIIAVFSVGCLTPRSAGFGQTADALAPGVVDVGVSTGAAYQRATPGTYGVNPNGDITSDTWALPSVEGNALIGLGKNLGLNLHLSAAGIQPGVKWTFHRGPLTLAALPAVAVGYAAMGGTRESNSGSISAQTSQFTFLAGIKGIASFDSGLYAGLGYDFEYVGQVIPNVFGPIVGGAGATPNTVRLHTILAAVGYQLSFGAIHLRPEIAFLWTPVSTGVIVVNGDLPPNLPSSSRTQLIYLFPNVTLSVDSGRTS